MATPKEHYQNLLADVYAWMCGGFDRAIAQNSNFFIQQQIQPQSSKNAIDLGCGCGFQSIPLAKLGFSVIAIDTDSKLLDELRNYAEQLDILTIEADLVEFHKFAIDKAEIIVCMTDTLLHLETKERVITLFEKVFNQLESNGKFILTFRDLSTELSELDRFIPLKSDAETIFTCFLEYEPETVKVHDLVYRLKEGNWNLSKSFYRKLRLSAAWVESNLDRAGFGQIESFSDRNMVTIIATK